jgi:hypothetical protein
MTTTMAVDRDHATATAWIRSKTKESGKKFVSIAALSKETGLSGETLEEVLD